MLLTCNQHWRNSSETFVAVITDISVFEKFENDASRWLTVVFITEMMLRIFHIEKYHIWQFINLYSSIRMSNLQVVHSRGYFFSLLLTTKYIYNFKISLRHWLFKRDSDRVRSADIKKSFAYMILLPKTPSRFQLTEFHLICLDKY